METPPKVAIKPTIGRVVWYHDISLPDSPPNDQIQAAIVAFVWSDTMVNLTVFDSNGVPSGKTSVVLYQGEGDRPNYSYCEWMPYQQGQAAKTEQTAAQMVTREEFEQHKQDLQDAGIRLLSHYTGPGQENTEEEQPASAQS